MPQITLNSKQINELADFIKKHNLKTFFMAKDSGAYIGATAGSTEKGNFENIIFHFRGMNPSKDEDAYENAMYAFGGDDFGETLNVDFVLKMAEKSMPKLTIKVTETAITMNGTFKKDAPIAVPKIAAKPLGLKTNTDDKPKMNKGQTIRHLLAKGMNETLILRVVDTTINSIRWHKSQMSAA